VLFLFRGLGDYMSVYFPGRVGRRVIKAIRGDLFRHYLALPTRYYDREGTGHLLSRLTYNVEQVAEAVTKSITSLIRDTLTIIVLLSVVVYINWKLALFVLILAPPLSWLIRNVSRSFRRYSGRIQSSMGDVTSSVKEALDGHRVIKVFNAQEAEAGDFMAFITATLMTTAPLKRLMDSFAPLQQGLAAGASIFELLDIAPEDLKSGRPLPRVSGELEFRDVSFEYTSEKGGVLHSVNLRVPAGKNIAIVGPSGSGKTTLAALVPRFYDATSGAVLVDGIDVRECNLRDLRQNVSLVNQDVLLFNDSIRNNIAFGVANPDPAAVEKAARIAYVDEFASKLPQGMDTQVGERGSELSGGQKQRIAIARALLKDAPILILDEATSALDNESERRIQEALVELVRNRTTLVIAHRLSTIEHADEIIVMEAGRIVERGTHADLVAREGAYAGLKRAEFRG
jgi:subfamily B ATP-binding cassette protein MsbA